MAPSSKPRLRLQGDLTRDVFVFIFLAVALAYTFPRWADPNQNSRLDMVVAFVENGSFRIDDYVANTVDYAKVDGHYYSDKAPGIAFLGIPIYAGVHQALTLPALQGLTQRLATSSAFQSTLRPEGSGVTSSKVYLAIAQVTLTFFLAVIPTALIGVLLLRLANRYTQDRRIQLAAALSYGLLTPAFSYGGALYGHQLSAMLLLAAFVGIDRGWFELSALRGGLLGLILGATVIVEYPAFLGVVVLFGWFVVRCVRACAWRPLGSAIAGALLLAVGLMVYNASLFGGALNFGYEYSELWVQQHSTGFMSLGVPSMDALWGITFGVFRGLFVLAPWLLLAIPGSILWFRSGRYRTQFWVSQSIVMLFFLFNGSSAMWWGGFAVGPRYILPALPLMVIPALFSAERWIRTIPGRFLLGLSGAWSLIATWGLTLADQAFPSDTIANPLVDYALPHWLQGDVARNLGHLMGLEGVSSLVPLIVLLLALTTSWMWLQARRTDTGLLPVEAG